MACSWSCSGSLEFETPAAVFQMPWIHFMAHRPQWRRGSGLGRASDFSMERWWRHLEKKAFLERGILDEPGHRDEPGPTNKTMRDKQRRDMLGGE